MSASSLAEQAKKKASYQAIESQVSVADRVIGIGSGSTVVYAVERLSQLYAQGKFPNLKACIPSSFQAQQLVLAGGLPLATLNEYPEICVAFDGADEVDLQGNCIKGGGGCQLQEKLVIANAKRWFIVADYRKDSDLLGKKWTKGVPIEVIPMAYKAVIKKLEKLGGKSVLRMATSKAGPCITDNGMFLLDTTFPESDMARPRDLDVKLQQIPGIVETGLFCGLANGCFFGLEDGNVKFSSYIKKDGLA